MATSTLGSGTLVLAGTTSGTTTVTATAVAGTTTLTLPAATDTLVGKATTDTLTNKTLTTPTISSLSSAAATNLTLQSAGTTAITIDTSQNLGIGTSSPYKSITVGATDAAAWITAGGPNTNLTISSVGSSGSVLFRTGGTNSDPSTTTERARIDSSGNLLVGTTNNSNLTSAQGLYLRGTGADNCLYGLNNATTTSGVSLALFYSSFSTANQTKFEVKSNGDVSSRTNSYGGFSDVRLKQGITPASSQWSDIKNIEVVKFQMKSEQFSDAENPWMLGVIAQQVEQVSPRLVDEDVKDGMKTVKYSILYMKAVKALQEAMARIEQLEVDVAALKGTA